MNTDFPVPALEFSNPVLNATGSLGFAPDLSNASIEDFGAFVTNPIGTRARKVANQPALIPFPGGVLMHTGYPNPGMGNAIKTYAARWEKSPIPIIVHLLSARPEELRKAAIRLEGIENIMAIEIGVEASSSASLVAEMVRASFGELPIIAYIPLSRALDLAGPAMEGGAAAISLGAPRGALPNVEGKLISGRLYGRAIFPQALEMVKQLTDEGIPVIGAGGVETEAQASTMLKAGAMAVQTDVGIWKVRQLR